jgi:two-component system, LuxR family, sensor kinase FixL
VLTLTALLVGVLVDERAQTAAELRNSLRFAAAGQMSAALAHELNQPLTALANYAAACRTLAASGELDADRRKLLEQTLDALAGEAQRAGHVIRRLRDFFRAGASALVHVCPNATIEEAVQAQRSRAGRRGVTLMTDVDPELPPIWLDPVQIAVVARNLLANAIDSASGNAGGQVRVKAHRSGRSVVVAIHDTGPGLDSQRIQTIFDAAPSSKVEGLGVGLSICRAIVEAHGGKLWAEPGSGGQFLFSLPIDDHVSGSFEPAP